VKTKAVPPPKSAASLAPDLSQQTLVRRHLRAGWWGLLCFLTLGIVLEILHGFKIGYYLDVTNHTRRLMWTLAHAHGTLLAVVNLAFAFSLTVLPNFAAKQKSLSSVLLLSALILLPAGFFLGGLIVYSGDPGLGILLVPVGALFLLIAAFLTAKATH
jgi:hypothetical protein